MALPKNKGQQQSFCFSRFQSTWRSSGLHLSQSRADSIMLRLKATRNMELSETSSLPATSRARSYYAGSAFNISNLPDLDSLLLPHAYAVYVCVRRSEIRQHGREQCNAGYPNDLMRMIGHSQTRHVCPRPATSKRDKYDGTWSPAWERTFCARFFSPALK